ncbi:hypothetical protein P3W85_01105 [Cupriavidus basilensis]|uniref:Zinc-binding domain-containing protein n=1 Tax=Cupriavidus basilensis TaxID=68895 RepID=A0ABT6AGI1_9BURK|nr:hypothetical protein [Cupriavidus basilensis]MDF3831564.1 hypothetical protein [Cupriavidus basilensis]
MYDRAALPRPPEPSITARVMRDTATPCAAPACHAVPQATACDMLMSDIGLLKRCRHCGEYWPADSEFFARDARRQDGLEHICKACRKEQRLVR